MTLVLLYVVESGEQEEHFSTENAAIALPKTSNKKIAMVQTDNRFQHRFQLREKMAKATDEPINLFPAFDNKEEISIQEEVSIMPEVPTSPYLYAGKLLDDGKMIVFLTDGRKKYAVKTGDIIEDTWKVKLINPPEMTLQYLPSNTQVSVQIGEIL